MSTVGGDSAAPACPSPFPLASLSDSQPLGKAANVTARLGGRWCRTLSGQRRPELSPAAKVLTAVISRPTGQSAVVDAGHKATGPDRGLAVLEGIPGAQATRFSAEHGVLALEGEAAQRLKPGDKAWLVPFDLGLCINQYDYIRAVRGGKLEGFWSIAGRGRFG